MEHKELSDHHRPLRLDYFPSPKSMSSRKNRINCYKVSNKAKTEGREMKLISVGCDCACVGHK